MGRQGADKAMNILGFLRALPANEPILVGGAVTSALTLGATFGLHLTAEQIAGVASASVTLVSLIMRQAVTPTATATPAPTTVAPPPVQGPQS